MSAGLDLRLVHLRVEGFGRLRDFEFEPEPVPGTIVMAPNEAGKSTLVSAIHRGLFGFPDKAREEARRPWESGPFRVTQRWRLGDDTECTIVRDFDSQEVSVEWRRRTGDGGSVLEGRWEGSPNPRGRSVELTGYQAELERLLGFTSPRIFQQTVLTGRGDPDVRPLEAELLRRLSGGERADFRAALETLAEGWYRITQADLEDPSRQVKRTPRKIEELEARRRELDRRREAALAAGALRRAAEEALERTRADLERHDGELGERARAMEAILAHSRVRDEIVAAEKRLAELDDQSGRFHQWEETFRERELELRPLAGYLGKPDDYAERLGEIERLDREIRARRLRAETARRRPPAPASRRRAWIMAGSAGPWILAAGAAWFLDAPWTVAAGLGAVAALLLLGAGWIALRARGRPVPDEASVSTGEIAELESRRKELASSLDLGSRDDPVVERERFRQAQRLRDQLDGMKETHGALGDRAALEKERRQLKERRLDVLRLEERHLQEEHPWLARDPDYERRFLSETESVEKRAAGLRSELLEAERRLAALPAPDDDPSRLAAEIDSLDRAREETALERDAHRLAYRTLLGCKDEFMRVATARLTGRIGTVFEDLSGGRYTDVRIDPQSFDVFVDGPERLGVAAADLSRGAQDQLYFALRVAVVEGLATDRALPLVLDDPFLHFDEERLGLAGRALRRLGERHQILLFTHDPRLAGWDFPHWVLPAASLEVRPSVD
ncbi:MAG: ATP-binding protein [Gemmatimonadota bacterium]